MHYCKICGNELAYLEDLNDFYCTKCKIFQSSTEDPKTEYKLPQVKEFAYAPVKAELERFQKEVKSPWQDTPFVPNQPFIIRRIIKFGTKEYKVLDVQGKTLGIISLIPTHFDGDFKISDPNYNQLAFVNAHIGLLEIQERRFDIFDQNNKLRGAIVRKKGNSTALAIIGFANYIYEIYDHTGCLIYRGCSSKFIGNHSRLISNSFNHILFMYEQNYNPFKEELKITISPLLDPLLAIAYVMILELVYRQRHY
ncbi:MAG: hypothetical protein ACFFDW_17490 [Candidatus Thorarchaeota archaeon]